MTHTLSLLFYSILLGQDCNSNGIDDATDLSPGPILFDAMEVFPLPEYGVEVATADFNRDGHLDVAAVTSSGIHILLGRGSGRLEHLASSPLPYTAPLVASDINGDGKTDLAAATQDGIAILLASEDDTLDEQHFIDIPSPSGMAAADLDGDGDLDLGVLFMMGSLRSIAPTIALMLNDGLGSFVQSGVNIDLGHGFHEFVLRDLDGDGGADIAATTADSSDLGGLAVYLNPLAASPPTRYLVENEAFSLTASNLDDDTGLDIALVHGTFAFPPAPRADQSISVLLNRGNGIFSPPSTLQANLNCYPRLTAHDLDQDGRLELITRFTLCCPSRCAPPPDPISTFAVWKNVGGGAFPVPQPWGTGLAAGSPVAGDIDGDGAADLILPTADGISVHHNRTRPPLSLDLNHNGIPDECELPPPPQFHRADPNSSGTTDISDAIAVFGFLFLGDAAPACRESADSNNDGAVDISDGIFLLSWLFGDGEGPAPPGPPGTPCGVDPDPAGSERDLGCETYGACE